MATEYHLLTCLGQGVTATLTIAAPCVVTYNASGMRSGHPVVWEANGDTLPTGLTHGTTYYVRPIDANTFHIYDTEARAKDTGSTTGRIDTSGAQSGTHKLVGEYWYRLPDTDPGGGGNYRGRYLYGGSYQCFPTWYDWHGGRAARASQKTELTLEIQGAWTDAKTVWTANGSISGYYSVTITTMVNGARGDGYHGGQAGAGWVMQSSSTNLRVYSANNNTVIDGVDFDMSGLASNSAVTAPAGSVVRNCIARSHATGKFLAAIESMAVVCNNILIGGDVGLQLSSYALSRGATIYNNLVVGATTGVSALTGSAGVTVVNNAAIGCATNWSVAVIPSGSFFANNAGAAGDSPWTSSGEPSVTTLTTAHFVDYANGDYRPTSDSPLVDAGDRVFLLMEPRAITNALEAANGDPRPSYKGGAATAWDIGPFEYDHGYGLAPEQVAIDITGMIEGSVLAIYRASDHAEIVAPTTIGASGAFSTTYSWTGNVSITVVVRKATGGTKYLPYSAPGLITAGGFGLVVNQVEDLVLNG